MLVLIISLPLQSLQLNATSISRAHRNLDGIGIRISIYSSDKTLPSKQLKILEEQVFNQVIANYSGDKNFPIVFYDDLNDQQELNYLRLSFDINICCTVSDSMFAGMRMILFRLSKIRNKFQRDADNSFKLEGAVLERSNIENKNITILANLIIKKIDKQIFYIDRIKKWLKP